MVTRSAFLVVHRWVGLTLGLIVTLSGLTGCVLVVSEPIDDWAYQHLLRVSGAKLDLAALDAAQRKVSADYPAAELTFRLPASEGDSLEVRVRGSFRGSVFFDPSSARELGRRADSDHPFTTLFELHRELLSGDTGKFILLCGAIGFLAMVIAGYVLWWPKSVREGFAVSWKSNLVRVVLDLHRVVGASIAIVILVSVASGAWMAWRPIGAGVNVLAGTPALAAPRIAPLPGLSRAPLSTLVRNANEAMPGGRVSIVPWSQKPDRAVRLRKHLDDEVHPNGLSVVWLHPQTGAVLAKMPWRDADVATRGTEYLFPLHAGLLGGPLHKVLIALCGALLASFGMSGVWLWWKRGRRVL